MKHSSEKGQTLPLALIVITVAALLVAFIAPQFQAISRSRSVAEQKVFAYYTAEAGINILLADLRHGADVAGATYTMPSVTTNDYTPQMTISLPQADQSEPAAPESYFDPNTGDPHLKSLQPGNGYLFRLYLHPGKLQVNWSYSPAGLTRIGVWQGETSLSPGRISSWPDEEPLYSKESLLSHNQSSILTIISPGVYDIVFFNPLWQEKKLGKKTIKLAGKTKTTSPCTTPGDSKSTWVFASAYKDYLLSSTAGDTTITVYVRQIPGPCAPPLTWTRKSAGWSEQEVITYTWREN